MATHIRMLAAYLVIVVVLAWLWYRHQNHTTVCSGVQCWSVIAEYPNTAQAAALLTEANRRMLVFIRALRDKYSVDLDDETVRRLVASGKISGDHLNSDKYKIILSILRDYDPSRIEENDPAKSGETSYNINKGERLVVCLRQKRTPEVLVDINTLMYVMLHEVGGHIGSYDVWGHPERFWQVFKFILREAVAAGVYTRVDYRAHPVNYCGLVLDYQPLDDKTIVDL